METAPHQPTAAYLCLRSQLPEVLEAPLHIPVLRVKFHSRDKMLLILERVSQLLRYAHDLGMLHKVLTPDCIHVGDDLAVMLSGWHTAPGAPPVTSYSSPEVARKSLSEIDARSDLFSLGAVWYEWLSGKPPFTGDSPLALLRSIVNNQPEALSHDHPWAIRELITRLLQTDKNLRPLSAEALSLELSALSTEQSAQTLPSAPRETPNLATDDTQAPSGGSNPSLSAGAVLPSVEGGAYTRLEELGRGGLGLVTRAQDKRLGREVAIKELLRNRGNARARFLREALITAKLQHPGVVPIYEAGFWPSGEPFYAMKLIAGKALDKIIKESRSLNERLALLPNVLAASEAMAYAHHHKIIHRDLKPANIIVGEFGETIVIDWGLAKETSPTAARSPLSIPENGEGNEAEAHEGGRPIHSPGIHPGEHYRENAVPSLTQTGEIMGTPAYMPLEQAKGQVVDARADVYSLGAILYHVLTGKPPYIGKKSIQVLQSLMDTPPAPADTHEPNIPKALLAIVNKSMARQMEDRYPSAKEFVDDLKKYLSGQLVGAYQYSLWEQVKLKISQNKAAFIVGLVAALVLVVGGGISVRSIIASERRATTNELRANEQRDIAVALEEEARQKSLADRRAAMEETFTTAEALLDSNPRGTLQKLQTLARDYPEFNQWDKARTLAADALSRGIPRLLPAGDASVGENQQSFLSAASWVGYSPDGAVIAASSIDGEVKLWSATGELLSRLKGHSSKIWGGAFSPNGALLATTDDQGEIRVWEIPSGKERLLLKGHPSRIFEIAFSPDGKRLVSAGDKQLLLWELEGGERVTLGGHGGRVFSVAFSPDGQQIVSAGEDGLLYSFSIQGEETIVSRGEAFDLSVRFSPDGAFFVSSNAAGQLRFWSSSTKKMISSIDAELFGRPKLQLSPDGSLLLRHQEQSIELWPVAQCLKGRCQPTFLPKKNLSQAMFSPDMKWLALAGGAEVHLFDTKTMQRSYSLRGHRDGVMGLGFSSDSRSLVSSGADGVVFHWALQELETHALYPDLSDLSTASLSSKGDWLALAADDGQIQLIHLITKEKVLWQAHSSPILSVDFSPDGQMLVSSGGDGLVQLWSVPDGRLLKSQRAHSASVFVARFSPDQGTVLSAPAERSLGLWDLSSGEVTLRPVEYIPHALDFLPALDAFAVLDNNHSIHLYESKREQARVIPLHEVGAEFVLRASPDGRFLAATLRGNWIQLCSLRPTIDCSRILKGVEGQIYSLEFSADGGYLTTSSGDGVVHVWETSSWTSRALQTQGAAIYSSLLPGAVLVVEDAPRVRLIPDGLPTPDQLRRWLQARAL